MVGFWIDFSWALLCLQFVDCFIVLLMYLPLIWVFGCLFICCKLDYSFAWIISGVLMVFASGCDEVLLWFAFVGLHLLLVTLLD